MPALQHSRPGSLVLFALSLLLSTGCVTINPDRVPVLQGAEKQIGSTQVIVALRHQEIGTRTPGSDPAAFIAGGLLGSLIDSVVVKAENKKADKLALPIRRALTDYDFGKTFSTSLKAELTDEGWLKNIQSEVRPLPDIMLIRSWVADSRSDAVFIIDTDYRLTPGFDGITINVRVSLHAPHISTLVNKGATREGLPEVHYFNQFAIVSFLPLPEKNQSLTAEDWVQRWTADGNQTIRQALDTGLTELAQMIAFDLKQPGTANNALYSRPPGGETKIVNLLRSGRDVPGYSITGFVIKTVGTRVWVRLPGGQLIAAPK